MEALARIEARLNALRMHQTRGRQDGRARLFETIRDDPARRDAWALLEGPALDALIEQRVSDFGQSTA